MLPAGTVEKEIGTNSYFSDASGSMLDQPPYAKLAGDFLVRGGIARRATFAPACVALMLTRACSDRLGSLQPCKCRARLASSVFGRRCTHPWKGVEIYGLLINASTGDRRSLPGPYPLRTSLLRRSLEPFFPRRSSMLLGIPTGWRASRYSSLVFRATCQVPQLR